MRVIEVKPVKLKGVIKIPPSKSYAHRAVICASLSNGISTISNVMLSDDVMATIKAMESLGANINYISEDVPDFFTLVIKGSYPLKVKNNIINCRQSASTLRFTIPLSLTTNEKIAFTANGRLIERPLDDYYKIFDSKKILYQNNNGLLPLIVQGMLKSGVYRADTHITSQTISALLMALPLLEGNSKIKTQGPLSSKDYISMTMDIMSKAGVGARFDKNTREFLIRGDQKYNPLEYTVEADFSSASFWLCAGAMGCDVVCKGLDLHSKQADKALLAYLSAAGAKIMKNSEGIVIRSDGGLAPFKINIDATPDLLPAAAVLACSIKGLSQITGLRRLKFKESDRIKTTISMINGLGGDIVEISDGLIIKGTGNLEGGMVHTANDHRIAMAAATASVISKKSVIITYADCVGKSYPQFWDDLKLAGGKIEEYYMGR